MRRAAIEDHWTHCHDGEQAGTPHISVLDIEAPWLDRSIVSFSGRLNVLVGENGANKSSLVQLLAQTVGLQDYTATEKHNMARCRVSLRRQGVEFSTYKQPNGICVCPQDIPIELINPGAEVQSVLSYYSSQENLEELKAQHQPLRLDEKSLALVNHLLARSYSQIAIYEFDEAVGELTVPYFVVQRGTLSYEPLSMGVGEFAALYLFWRLRNVSKGSLIFIDEPETFLSPKTQLSFLDYLAFIVDKTKGWALVASHSEHIARRVRLKDVSILRRFDDVRYQVTNAQYAIEVLVELGLRPSQDFLLCVEDIDAKVLVELILTSFLPWTARRSQIRIIESGADDLVAFGTKFPRDLVNLKAVTILDGDKRKEWGPQINGRPIVFLPSIYDPILNALGEVQHHHVAIAHLLGAPAETVRQAILQTAGTNYHDRCSAISERIGIQGITTDDVRRAVLKNWVQLADSRPSIDAFVADIQPFLT